MRIDARASGHWLVGAALVAGLSVGCLERQAPARSPATPASADSAPGESSALPLAVTGGSPAAVLGEPIDVEVEIAAHGDVDHVEAFIHAGPGLELPDGELVLDLGTLAQGEVRQLELRAIPRREGYAYVFLSISGRLGAQDLEAAYAVTLQVGDDPGAHLARPSVTPEAETGARGAHGGAMALD